MRRPKPFYRRQTGSWYVQVGKQQIPLGRDEKQAWIKYHALMVGNQEPRPEMPVASLLDDFLEWSSNNQARATYEWYRKYLQSFSDHCGKLRVCDLKTYHVTRWIDARWRQGKRRPINDGTRRNAIRAVKRVFSWAVKSDILERSPVRNIEMPPAGSREIYITPEQWAAFLEAVPESPFRDFVQFLRWTGARPQEARIVEARHLDGKGIVLDRIESKGKKRRRVIPLTIRAHLLVKRLAEKWPEGAIFRNEDGVAWTNDAVNCAFDRFEKKLAFKVYAYAIRHTFITDMLVAGIDPVKLAEIVGHRDLKMIHSVYQHLQLKRDHLREELRLGQYQRRWSTDTARCLARRPLCNARWS
jgi:integrase/recombinase XerC